MKDHRLIDQRSLAFDRMVASKLRANPELIDYARANIARWMPTMSPNTQPAMLEWLTILDQPLTETLEFLACADERATRLRQSSPFAGVLTYEERTTILLHFEALEAGIESGSCEQLGATIQKM